MAPRFHDLPAELVFLIIGEIELLDQFFLAQTCRRMRALARRDWLSEARTLPSDDQLTFWTGLARSMPGHWVCGSCLRLHPMSSADTPLSMPTACGREEARSVRAFYKLKHSHVQMALKSRRLGVHKEYLQALMEPYTFECLYRNDSKLGISIVPKIAWNRFLLQVEWKFSESLLSRDCPKIKFCRHLEMDTGPNRWPFGIWSGSRDDASFFLAVMQFIDCPKRFESPEPKAFYRCKSCPTKISLKLDKSVVFMSACYDFGPEASPSNSFWIRHFRAPPDFDSDPRSM